MRRTLSGAILLLATIVPSVLFADSASAAPPANDDLFFAEPIVLNSVVGFFNNTDATTQIGEPDPSCQSIYSRSVWYKYTADANRTLQAVTTGSGFDTVLAVYSTTNPFPGFGNLTPVACDDDSGVSNNESIVTFAAVAGNTYYIQASSFGGNTGFLIVGFGEPLLNDNLSSAQAVAPPHSSPAPTAIATTEIGEPACFTSRTVWYKATLPAGSYRARVDAGTGDSGLGVYSGPAVSPTFPALTQLECDDDGGGGVSSQVIIVTGGGTFYFQVGTLAQGNFTFTLNVIPDSDGDGVADQSDNCPFTQNGPLQTQVIGVGNQFDNDGDGLPGTEPPYGAGWGGDACDFDDDNDGIIDSADAACPFSPEDFDGFEDGDGCPDADNDGDGICDQGQGSVSCSGSDLGRYLWKSPLPVQQDCRNVAEDFDSFHDSDGCPEQDNDYDNFPDATDDCPATDTTAGPDGIADTGDEPVLYLTPVQTREDFDGVLDNDGCHDSPGDDYDLDGYSDENEALKIGTNPAYSCGNAGWPSDLLSTGLSTNKLDVQDIISFIAPVRRLDTSPNQNPPSNYLPRWDLAPGANFPFLQNHISIFDITTMLNGAPGSPAYPPMFGGPRAFLKDCPLAP